MILHLQILAHSPIKLLNWLPGIVLLATMSTMLGCQSTADRWQSGNGAAEGEYVASSVSNLPATGNVETENQTETSRPRARPEIYAGQPPAVRPPASVSGNAKRQAKIQGGGDIMLRFADTPVREVVELILGFHLEKEFSVAQDVQGLISLDNQQGLQKGDLMPTLEALLSGVNARLVRDGQAYRVVSGARHNLAPSGGNLEIIPLRYIDAAEFSKILDAYQVSSSVIERGNLLAVSGTAAKLRQVRELTRSFDINWLKGMSIGMFPVHNTEATTVHRELLEMFGTSISQELAGALRIVAVEHTNAIMVISSQRDYVQMMGNWVERLDQVGDGSEQKFFVYRVQNGRAADLAELLRQMFGGGAPQEPGADPFAEGEEQGAVQPGNDFRVIADESTNSIIVSGSPHYYKFVREAMRQLDSTPLQVLVEARIMELTLTDDLQYGLEFFLSGSHGSSDTSARLDFGNTGIGAAAAPSFSYVIERAGEVRAALNALADDSRLKVLSSPSLMVLNNQTASILVGDEVPIPTRQATSNISPDAPTVNEIEYRNTGILLTVAPRVNSGGLVTMDISQEVSSVVNNTTSQIDAPTIQQRQLNSTVSIRSGQTVVLGGLIREQNSTRESGVPLLKDLPAVGKLFSATNNRVQRTELVVLITPRVILNEQDSAAITDEYRRKMIGLKPIPLHKL